MINLLKIISILLKKDVRQAINLFFKGPGINKTIGMLCAFFLFLGLIWIPVSLFAGSYIFFSVVKGLLPFSALRIFLCTTLFIGFFLLVFLTILKTLDLFVLPEVEFLLIYPLSLRAVLLYMLWRANLFKYLFAGIALLPALFAFSFAHRFEFKSIVGVLLVFCALLSFSTFLGLLIGSLIKRILTSKVSL